MYVIRNLIPGRNVIVRKKGRKTQVITGRRILHFRATDIEEVIIRMHDRIFKDMQRRIRWLEDVMKPEELEALIRETADLFLIMPVIDVYEVPVEVHYKCLKEAVEIVKMLYPRIVRKDGTCVENKYVTRALQENGVKARIDEECRIQVEEEEAELLRKGYWVEQ